MSADKIAGERSGVSPSVSLFGQRLHLIAHTYEATTDERRCTRIGTDWLSVFTCGFIIILDMS
jgi:hypothetical protein